MAKTQSWEVSDALWQQVQPLVPKAPERPKRQRYQRRPGGGRKPLENRQIFAGIVYVLRTGCQWKALPKSFGSASSVHKHFQRWRGQGFFLALWQAGLAEHDEMEGIAWEWQSLDGTQGKVPLAQEAVGNNPTDRGKKGGQRSLLVDGAGVPLSLIVSGANRHDVKLLAITKNKEKKRDPEMHQTRKGNQWYFGLKAHIGADRDSKLVPTVVVTAANVADITQTSERLHGQEHQVHADAGCTGVEKRAEMVALERKIDWQLARKRGQIKALAVGAEKATLKAVEKAKASVRAFVEHPFHILKNIFGHRKVRCRGPAKNGHPLYTLFGLANVVIGGRTATR